MQVFWCRIDPWLADPSAFTGWCRAKDISLADFWDPRDAVPHIAARALLALAWRRTRSGPLPPVRRTRNGKPYFRAPAPFFSLSHSGGLVLCALGGQPVGVDAEALRPVSRDLLAFLRPEELAHLRALAEPRRTAAFYGLWTRKESLVKMTGAGLGALRDAESAVAPDGTWRDSLGGRPVRSLDICPEEYAAAICLAEPEAVETVPVPWQALRDG